MTNEEILEKLNHKDGLIKTVEIHKAMEAARKDEAERFAGWILAKAYTNYDSGCWYLHESMSGETYTTSELYQIFKTQTNG